MRMTSLSATLSTLQPVTCTSITMVFDLYGELHQACCFMRLHQIRPTDAWREYDVQPCTDASLKRQREFNLSQVTYFGVRSNGGSCQGRPAVCRAFIHMVEEIPRQDRLEGCHRMSAATHLICGLESVE